RRRRLFEQQTGVPAMRYVRRLEEAEAVTAGRERLLVGERPRRARREVVHARERADEAAERRRRRRERQPFVQRPALVGLEVAEPDPTDRRRVDERRDRVADE